MRKGTGYSKIAEKDKVILQEGNAMPTVTGADGIEREISQEEFMEALASGGKITGIQQVITDKETGEELQKYDIPVAEDGSFDLFGGGLFGELFGDHRDLEEKIADAEDGDENTIDELAMLYLNGEEEQGITLDTDKAFYWTQKLADIGNSNGMFNMGMFYAKGFGTQRDFVEAARWMEKAVEYGDEDAIRLVDEFRAAAERQEKADAGDARAQAEQAEFLIRFAGSLAQAGVEKDYADAFELAQKSAAQDNGYGLYALALAYEHGRGVERDVDKALEYYRKGTELGDVHCMHNLGCFYMRGDYLEENKPLALEYCHKAAEQGYALSEFFMAKVYETGDGVAEDLDEALVWGEKAAEHGTAEIQYQVAKLYTYTDENGKMIDAERARYWYGKAAEGGDQMAWQVLNFAPMWAEEEFDPDEEDDEEFDEDPGILAAMNLINVALQNGMKPGAGGTSQEIDGIVAFVRDLAEKGDPEAREALDAFLTVAEEVEETDESEAPEPVNERRDPAEEAAEYLEMMQSRFRSYKSDWETFPKEIYDKCYAILSKNVKTEEDIEKNRLECENYVASLADRIQAKADCFRDAIEEFDVKLTQFWDQGLEETLMVRLVKQFAQWVDYAGILEFEVLGNRKEYLLPEVYLSKKKQWLAALPEEIDPVQEIRNKRQAEADRIQTTLKAEYDEEFATLKTQYDADLKKINDKKSQVGKELSEKKAYLDTLGFFQFAEKKTTRNAIIALEQTKSQLQRDVEALKDNFDRQKNALKQSIENSWDRQRKQIRKQFPTPRKISLFDIVLLGMDPGSKYTVYEIQEFPDVPAELTPRAIQEKIVSPLVAQGKLQRVYENGRTYFKLP